MLTTGSITRAEASQRFPFLADDVTGRRAAIRKFTHSYPEFVFWIYPDGRLHDAGYSHRMNVPKGHQSILDEEPDYGGFLRGRVARFAGNQLIVVYCRENALATDGKKLHQFMLGIEQLPIPLEDDTLVISDNGDIYGTLADVRQRANGT